MSTTLLSLQQYGLTEKESKVYLAALSLWSAPGSSIARTAWENRATVYSILKELLKQGLANEVNRNGVTYFSVVAPETLSLQLEEKAATFRAALPELMAIAEKFGNKPKVQFFEWVEGIKSMYEDTLTSETPIRAFLWTDNLHEWLTEYFYSSYRPRRAEYKIPAEVLLPYSKANERYIKHDRTTLKKSKTLKNPLFYIEWEINIYGPNKVAIALLHEKELSGIIIHSESFYKNILSIFQTLRSTSE